ncbi:DUF4932 domain-containing protein [Robiginitalea aurantiaca]|uniref:DUF4932 domain-containing protein n=1 Tax=Robiginitalea aurantiaca TaxID=3056915 RepID=A0ABT7WB00_9FLAO|nr:DUF4932 domain-containing protein [Robiginitalea aurantiaca]MDM9630094.1 DUF4932 domain-containing protein [Robiginitalea aurantiaca]
MKYLIITLALLLTFGLKGQKNVTIELPESYELSNIVLALTQYGQTDRWDVQKIPPYYDRVMEYFEPVKDHPLLDSVNYSRKKWEKFLGFRTDAYAFSFDDENQLKRDFEFQSFSYPEFDKNIHLVNDFVEESNFRKFYRDNRGFYDQIIANYKEYYFVNRSKAYLEKIAGKTFEDQVKYKIVISPLVGGQNCHRDIDSLTTADFPNISKELILGDKNVDMTTRIIANHSLFTEMDHGYLNPISDTFEKQIEKYYNKTIWDKESGYMGIDSFNEYITWAVYDAFVKEEFPEYADAVTLPYHYVNVQRGFIASEFFAKKVVELMQKNKSGKIEDIYLPLLKWCKEQEGKVVQPAVKNGDKTQSISLADNAVQIEFTQPMDENIKTFQAYLTETKDGVVQGNGALIEIDITESKLNWKDNGTTAQFFLNTEFQEFNLTLNYGNILKPIRSGNQILLKPVTLYFKRAEQ